MLLNSILWVSILWINPMMYVMLKNEAKFKKNIAVGVTLPFDGRENAEVLARLEKYKKELKTLCLVMALVPIPCILIRNFHVTFWLWGLWIILICFLPMIPFIRCNRDLMTMKRQQGWTRTKTETVTVDTAVMEPLRWISPVSFLLPLAVSILPFLWDREFWLVYLMDAAGVLFCWLSYRYLYRNKSERVDENAELTRVLTQVRRRNWAKMWQICAWLMALMNLVFVILIAHPILLTAAIVFVSIVSAVMILRVELCTRRVQEKLTAVSGQGSYVDEDDKWIWGMIYYDPNDRHNLVNSRIGTGSTFNMARPVGKIVVGLSAVLLLSIPFILPVTEAIIDKPPELVVTEETITARSGGKVYVLPREDVASAELLDELPEKLSRVAGTGMEHLLTGTFSAKDRNRVELCLDPTVPPFLKITTVDGKRYLFGTRVPGEAEAAFAALDVVEK